MEQVAKHCAGELDAYERCVADNPQTWSEACNARKGELNACAAKFSDVVSSLKERCRSEIEQYERCLKANSGNPATCAPQLERLFFCSEGMELENAHACGPDCNHGPGAGAP